MRRFNGSITVDIIVDMAVIATDSAKSALNMEHHLDFIISKKHAMEVRHLNYNMHFNRMKGILKSSQAHQLE